MWTWPETQSNGNCGSPAAIRLEYVRELTDEESAGYYFARTALLMHVSIPAASTGCPVADSLPPPVEQKIELATGERPAMQQQISAKKNYGLPIAIAAALISAGLPVVTACNPFKAVQNEAYPACQTNNTAVVAFRNGSISASRTFYVDGALQATLSPGGLSAAANYSAGVNHYVQIYNVGTFTYACAAAYRTWTQCAAYTETC